MFAEIFREQLDLARLTAAIDSTEADNHLRIRKPSLSHNQGQYSVFECQLAYAFSGVVVAPSVLAPGDDTPAGPLDWPLRTNSAVCPNMMAKVKNCFPNSPTRTLEYAHPAKVAVSSTYFNSLPQLFWTQSFAFRTAKPRTKAKQNTPNNPAVAYPSPTIPGSFSAPMSANSGQNRRFIVDVIGLSGHRERGTRNVGTSIRCVQYRKPFRSDSRIICDVHSK